MGDQLLLPLKVTRAVAWPPSWVPSEIRAQLAAQTSPDWASVLCVEVECLHGTQVRLLLAAVPVEPGPGWKELEAHRWCWSPDW